MKWYFCTLLYAKKSDNAKEGMIGMILYNKKKTYSFRKHVVTAHKISFQLFSYIDGQPKIVADDDASSLEGSV